jgi:hypothetical protein
MLEFQRPLYAGHISPRLLGLDERMATIAGSSHETVSSTASDPHPSRNFPSRSADRQLLSGETPLQDLVGFQPRHWRGRDKQCTPGLRACANSWWSPPLGIRDDRRIMSACAASTGAREVHQDERPIDAAHEAADVPCTSIQRVRSCPSPARRLQPARLAPGEERPVTARWSCACARLRRSGSTRATANPIASATRLRGCCWSAACRLPTSPT